MLFYENASVAEKTRGNNFVTLRNHPLLSYRAVHSWPPVWHFMGDGINKHPRGEVGILKEVKTPVSGPFNQCFLVIEYKTSLYMGCLLVDDVSFCISVGKFLQGQCGRSIEDISNSNISHML